MKKYSSSSHSGGFTREAGRKRFGLTLMRSVLMMTMLLIFGLGLALSSGKIWLVGAAQDKAQISDSAASQIQALLQEKESRTPAQRKIDSNLIYATKERRGVAIAPGVDRLETSVRPDADGKAVVDITVNDMKIAHTKIDAMHIEVLSAVGNNIRANVKLEDLETIAAFPEVRFIMPKQEAKLQDRPSAYRNYSYASPIAPWLASSLRPSFAD